ncbi:condensin complex subunit 2/barren [Mycotypha africana]|uniref:condensin complex subunit 2/barren n=1 Tax=Mycotypha africana TaxID=64632 RepID=UPI002301635F|nr:condensin complex subunit 2/barren [Mycotypha africana]KAI8987588.1 condensin complex subunit 2/barren [Mycotypha africana]
MVREPHMRRSSNAIVDTSNSDLSHANRYDPRSVNKRHLTSNETLGVQPSIPAISRTNNNINHPPTTGNRPVNMNMQPSVPALTPAQMYSNFEEWIKMCTDNKVNSTNTWNFALIDYFHEMTFLKEGDSINFQKASCTLDGCVKIYTSRVDSVANETGKLLSGLADSNTNIFIFLALFVDADVDDENGRQPGERRTRKRTNRSEATLLKDFSSIALKKFDLDFAIDPLFKKTSADFDEGGARGLLLNHLGLDQNCKIIFDASDATIEADIDELDGEHSIVAHMDQIMETNGDAGEKMEEDNDIDEQAKDDPMEAEDENAEKNQEAMELDVEETQKDKEEQKEENESDKDRLKPIEIARLKSRLPKFDALPSFHIVPFLKGYNFFADNDNEMTIPDLDDLDDAEDLLQQNNANPAPSDNNYTDIADDAFHFDEADDGFGMDFDDMNANLDPFDTQANFNINADDENDGNSQQIQQQKEGNVAESNEYDFLSALIQHGEDKEMLDYFDFTLKKNWAGPEHWKLRRPVTTSTVKTPTDRTTADGTSATVEKSKKRAKIVDFSIPFDKLLNAVKKDDDDEAEKDTNGEDMEISTETVDDDEHTFEPMTKKPSLTKEMIAKMADNQLPDDIQFSSKLLLQYSLKPTFPNKAKKRSNHDTDKCNIPQSSASQNNSPAEDGDPNNPDINFWADQGQDYGDEIDYGDMPTDNYDDEGTQMSQTMLTAFEDTSFAHGADANVVSGFNLFENGDDDILDAESAKLYGDELITSHSLKKTKPLYVNYARQAKRVDVKKLKDNLWKVLTTTTVTTSSGEKEDTDSALTEQHPQRQRIIRTDKVQGVQKFTDIVHNLKKLYSPKTMKDISVPFCFICLLHLANEKELSIQGVQKNSNGGDADDDDFVLGGDGDGTSTEWMENLNEITITQN